MTVNPRAKLYCHSIEESQIKSVMDLIVENLLLITILSISIILILWALVRRRNLNLLIMDEADFADDEENSEIVNEFLVARLMRMLLSQHL